MAVDINIVRALISHGLSYDGVLDHETMYPVECQENCPSEPNTDWESSNPYQGEQS